MDSTTNWTCCVSPRLEHCGQQRIEQLGLKILVLQLMDPPVQFGQAQHILRRHSAQFAVVVPELHRIGAVLVDHHDDIQAAASGPSRGRRQAGGEEQQDGPAG